MCSCIFASSTDQRKLVGNPQHLRAQWFAGEFESFTCTGSDDPSASVPFCYSGADLGETVDVKVDSFTNEAGTIDITGSGLESISCLGKSLSKMRFTPQSRSLSFASMCRLTHLLEFGVGPQTISDYFAEVT